MVWTLGGYAQDFIKRQLNDDIFAAHKDKLELTFLMKSKPPNPNETLLGIMITCPVLVKMQSRDLTRLLSKLEEQLALPVSRWHMDESDEKGCVKLCIFIGIQPG